MSHIDNAFIRVTISDEPIKHPGYGLTTREALHLIHRLSVAYSPFALRGRRSVSRSPAAARRTSFSVLYRLAYAAMTPFELSERCRGRLERP